MNFRKLGAVAALCLLPTVAFADATADANFLAAFKAWIATQAVAGPAGPMGTQGLPGAAGATGATGAIGNTGAQGPQGIQGPTGATGPAGPQGPQGIPGPQGPQGPAGSAGGGGTTTPPGTIAWSSVPPMGNNWSASGQTTAFGYKWWAETAQKPYDIQFATNTTSPLYRFETRDNEFWGDGTQGTVNVGGNNTRRSEFDGSAGATYPAGTVWNFAYSFMVEPGAPMLSVTGGNPGGPVAWIVPGQIHAVGNAAAVPVSVFLRPSGTGASYSERLQAIIQTDPGQTAVTLWTDPNPFVRGKVYDFQWSNIKIAGKATDTITLTVNGVQVASRTGVIGSATTVNPAYGKIGEYIGWGNDGAPPFAIQYANVYQGTGAIPQPRPAWPTVTP